VTDPTWRATALAVLDELETAGGIPAPPRVRAYRVVPVRSRCAECERLRILIARARAEPQRAAAVLEQALSGD
jgi:hypothetical protein